MALAISKQDRQGTNSRKQSAIELNFNLSPSHASNGKNENEEI